MKVKIQEQLKTETFTNPSWSSSGIGRDAAFTIKKINGSYSVVVNERGYDFVSSDRIYFDNIPGLVVLVDNIYSSGNNAGLINRASIYDSPSPTTNFDVVAMDSGVGMYVLSGFSSDFTYRKEKETIKVFSDNVENFRYELRGYSSIKFDDRAISFDDNAEYIYSVVYAATGETKPYDVGLAYRVISSGIDKKELPRLAVEYFFSNTTSEEFVEEVYTNILGSAPKPEIVETFAGLIDGNVISKLDLFQKAITTDEYEKKIEIIGVEKIGLEYYIA